MILRIRYTRYEERDGELEIWTNQEDLNAMLDRVKPIVIAEYLKERMKPRVEEEKREGGAR